MTDHCDMHTTSMVSVDGVSSRWDEGSGQDVSQHLSINSAMETPHHYQGVAPTDTSTMPIHSLGLWVHS